jgi:hypothetical protein
VVYTLANPVAANLVDHTAEWPGASSLALMGGGELTVRRPDVFFRDSGSMPEEVTLTAVPSPTWRGDARSWRESVHDALRRKENTLREARARDGLSVAGRDRVLRASPFDRPTTPTKERQLRPSIACKDPERRKLELGALRTFRLAYVHARERLRARRGRVIFPAGTYQLCRLGIVRCAPYQPNAPS